MKWQSLTNFLTAGVLALGATVTLNSPSQAQSTTFFCGTTSNGTPITLAQTPQGTVEVIRWVSKYFSGSGYTPQVRCQEVSGRFQSYYNSGLLQYITAGYLNGQPAICVGDGTSPCSSDRLLFTLKPGQNAAREIQQLFNIRSGASGPLYESTGGGNPVIDMEKFLEQAPIFDAGNTAPSEVTSPPTINQPSSPNNGGGLVW